MYDPYQELEHFGIKGMKWGIRRYQNANGSLTEAGKKRLKRYKEKEYQRVDNLRAKAADRYSREVYKRKSKGGTLPSKQEAYQKSMRDVYEKELKVIKKMKYKDMQSDKQVVGKQWMKSAGGSVALATAVSVAAGAPYMAVMIGPVTPSGISNAKTRNRMKRYKD